MAYANGYTYRRTVTIDHTKVEGSADLTNYPVLVKGTYTYLKTTANSGNVQSASGYDIIFTSDEAGSTVLDFERVSWSATTGEVVFYVEVPTVDYDANTVIYMFYGNASAETDQQDIEGTWNTNYKAVHHTSSISSNTALDSTSNNSDLTTTNMDGNNVVDGKIYKAFDFNGSDEYGTLGDFPACEGQQKIVASFWAYLDSLGNLEGFFKKFASATNRLGYTLVTISATPDDSFIMLANGANSYQYTNAQHIYSTGSWVLHQVYYDGSQATDATKLRLFLNGVEQTSTYAGGIPTTTPSNNNNFDIGRNVDNSTYYLDGKMEEFRFSNGTIPTVDWLKTDYNNQSSPSTFYTIGDETESGGDTVVKDIIGMGIIPFVR